MATRLLATLTALLWAVSAWAGKPPQASIPWGELGPRITGKKVALVLPDGTSVEGKVRGVDPDGLRLKISKTSNKKAQPKGVHTIPRQSVLFLQLTEYRKIGRLACTAGALAATGAFLALGARDTSITEGPLVVILPAVAAAGTVGIGIGGYYFGKAVDKRVTDIRVAPGN